MVIPGLVAASWMVMLVANAALAQGVLVRFGANWRPSPDLAGLGLPRWVPLALGLAAAAVALGGAPRFVGVNMLIALSVPFCLAGLAVLHAAARRLSHPAMALTGFYMIGGAVRLAVRGGRHSWTVGELARAAAPPGMLRGVRSDG